MARHEFTHPQHEKTITIAKGDSAKIISAQYASAGGVANPNHWSITNPSSTGKCKVKYIGPENEPVDINLTVRIKEDGVTKGTYPVLTRVVG